MNSLFLQGFMECTLKLMYTTMTLKNILFLFVFIIYSAVFSNNERYRLIITDDPARTITIGWDQVSGQNPIVYYDSKDHGKSYKKYKFSKTVDRVVISKGMNNNFVKLNDLLPNTAYYFIIKDSEGFSKRYWFRTAPDKNSPMTFISGGDSRNNREPRKNANLLVSKIKPTAVFFGGDMTARSSDAQWVEWFNDWQLTIANDGRMFPVLPTRGNHEDSNKTVYDLFDTPSKEVFYAITFGKDLYTIYTLNSEISAGGNQSKWLQERLMKDASIWKSAQYHKPMRPHQKNKKEGNDVYNNWATLFYKYHMDLVYESDSHVVKTTYPIKPCSGGESCEEGFERDDTTGIVFVGEGCWGAPIRPADDNKIWTRNSGSFNQFKWVTVSTSEIVLKTIMVDNADKVAENSNDEKPGILPSGISIWKPSHGETVVIKK